MHKASACTGAIARPREALFRVELEYVRVGPHHQLAADERFAVMREEYRAVRRFARLQLRHSQSQRASRRGSLQLGSAESQRRLATLFESVGRLVVGVAVDGCFVSS